VAVENETRKFVTFYFTNFPERANHWFLRKGFEVCGIRDDVYMAPRFNARGQAYGFLQFLKVKDVEKIVQAFNNVWFGDFRIWAKVARFKRHETEEVWKSDDVVSKGSCKAQVEEGGRRSGKPEEGKKGKDEGVVRVGEVIVRLNGKEGSVVRKAGTKGGENVIVGGAQKQETDKCKLKRKYRSCQVIFWRSRYLVNVD